MWATFTKSSALLDRASRATENTRIVNHAFAFWSPRIFHLLIQSFLCISFDHSTAPRGAHLMKKIPIRCEHIVEFGSFTGPPEEIVVHLSIPKDHYACEETIEALMHVENKTYYHTIHDIGLALMQHIHVSIGGHAKTETKTIVAQKVGPNLQHGKSEEVIIALQVPNNLLPTQTGRLISVQYQLEIMGVEEHFESQTWIPITIVGNY